MRLASIPIPLTILALGTACAVSACSGGGNSGYEPVVAKADVLKTSVLQFAIGTATYYSPPTEVAGQLLQPIGLNMVETLRQPNGLSALLFDVPVVTAPPTLALPATMIAGGGAIMPSQYGSDTGTNRFTQNGVFASTNGTGAFGYGFCACNSLSIAGGSQSIGGTVGAVGSPELFVPLTNPIFGIANTVNNVPGATYVGGAPAFPSTLTPLYSAAFTGYSLGFNFLAVSPVAGAYQLTVAVPPTLIAGASTATPSISATATLKNIAGLPPYPAPTFVPDGAGGGTFSIVSPPGVTETLVEMNVTSTCLGLVAPTMAPGRQSGANVVTYTVLAHGPGMQNVRLPDALGAVVNGSPTPTMCAQSTYQATAIGFDYPAFEASYPANRSQKPTIVGTGGQADITVAPVISGTYP